MLDVIRVIDSLDCIRARPMFKHDLFLVIAKVVNELAHATSSHELSVAGYNRLVQLTPA